MQLLHCERRDYRAGNQKHGIPVPGISCARWKRYRHGIVRKGQRVEIEGGVVVEKRKIETGTIARTAVLIFALLNQILTMTGKNPLPFSEDQVYTAVTGILTVGASLWAWWKNNSFTQAALEADVYKEEIKNIKAYQKKEEE